MHPHGRPVESEDERAGELRERDETWMRVALALAREAASVGEVPVGALIVREEQVVSQAYNLRETLEDPTAHAERLAITLAGRSTGSWRLDGCTLYVTLEPCPMCAGAIVQARLARVVYGTSDPKAGACRSLYRLLDDPRLNHRVPFTGDILAEDCRQILRRFFQPRRFK